MWRRGGTKRNVGIKSVPMLNKILWPMLVLTLLQIVIFLVVLALTGGFSRIKNYSYNIIFEKTENRKRYVESMMNQKTDLVYETAGEINALFEKMLAEEDRKVSELKTDKEFSKRLLSRCSDELISLLRRDMVNDVFLILDSGTLFDDGEEHLFPNLSAGYGCDGKQHIGQ